MRAACQIVRRVCCQKVRRETQRVRIGYQPLTETSVSGTDRSVLESVSGVPDSEKSLAESEKIALAVDSSASESKNRVP